MKIQVSPEDMATIEQEVQDRVVAAAKSFGILAGIDAVKANTHELQIQNVLVRYLLYAAIFDGVILALGLWQKALT